MPTYVLFVDISRNTLTALQILRYSLKNLLITLLSYFLWKVMRYVTFALLFKYEQGLIVCF